MPEPELRESWYEKQPVYSVPPPSSIVPPPPPPPPRAPRFGIGALVGGAASAGALVVAHLAAGPLHAADPIEIASRVGGGAIWSGFAVAVLAGAPFGGLLAVVLMHGARFITRAIFAIAVSVAVWFCVHIVFVAKGHVPPPILPMLAGAALFGLCVAFIPPARPAVQN